MDTNAHFDMIISLGAVLFAARPSGAHRTARPLRLAIVLLRCLTDWRFTSCWLTDPTGAFISRLLAESIIYQHSTQ